MATPPEKKPRGTKTLGTYDAAKHTGKAPAMLPSPHTTLDRNSRAYKAELRRQVHAINNAPDTEDVMKFIESLCEDWE